ncbi:hypothetical protein A9X02_16690 [Mycobacterium malmoense]|nr:hypothetical protein A9X02_16690 [Mycobacterium malmoense]
MADCTFYNFESENSFDRVFDFFVGRGLDEMFNPFSIEEEEAVQAFREDLSNVVIRVTRYFASPRLIDVLQTGAALLLDY